MHEAPEAKKWGRELSTAGLALGVAVAPMGVESPMLGAVDGRGGYGGPAGPALAMLWGAIRGCRAPEPGQPALPLILRAGHYFFNNFYFGSTQTKLLSLTTIESLPKPINYPI